MKCHGLHCGGCRGGRGVGLAAIVAIIIVGAWVCKRVAPAVSKAVHVLEVVLEVVFITIASAAGIAILAGLTWGGIRIHRRYAIRAAAADRRSLGQPIRVTAEVVQPEQQAIEAPRPVPSCPYEICHHNHPGREGWESGPDAYVPDRPAISRYEKEMNHG